MRLILLGPPGSGKGTQAKLLSGHRGLVHISTGELLRSAKAAGTPLGLRAKSYMDAGQLVPDELVNELVRERFQGPDRPTCFLMDGYPRTVAQARVFERLLAKCNLPLTAVVLINVSDEEILRRITGRLTCPNKECGAVYHARTNPPKVPGVCDRCGSRLITREDDNAETVAARLGAYHGETADLVPHYRSLGLLREVAGQGEIDTIYQNILAALQKQAGPTC
jgi:adenylate kinase